jgi:hypothetical protein
VLNHYQQQQQQYSQASAGDPVYSQIRVHGDGPRGTGDLVTRAPPPSMGYSGKENAPVYSRESDSSHVMAPSHRGRHINPLAVQVMPHLPPSMSANAPPRKVTPPKPQGWTCKACTMVNPPRRPSCEVCLTDRPDDYVVPEDAPLDDVARKVMESEKDFEEVRWDTLSHPPAVLVFKFYLMHTLHTLLLELCQIIMS